MVLTVNKRTTRAVIWMFVICILIYIPLNIIYIITVGRPKSVLAKASQVTKDKIELPINLKDLVPQADGTVDIVLSMNVNSFYKALDTFMYGNANGEATSNPLPANFSFTKHNPDLCKDNPNLDWIIYVHTAPGNVARRKILRSTWANNTLFKDRRTDVVFLVGTPAEAKDQKIIDEEFQKYGDMVQGSFVEHYRNLTLKGIMGLRWVSTYCQNAKYAIKADDDAFINIFELMGVVHKNEAKKNMVVCPLWKENTMPILRDPSKCMKWCVRYNEFPGKRYFPKYCAGLAFLLSRDLVQPMYEASKRTPFFWIDDVYITGLLTPRVNNVNYVDLLKNFTLKEAVAFEDYTKSKKPVQYYFSHVKKEPNFMQMWNSSLHRLSPQELRQLSRTSLMAYKDLYKYVYGKS